MVHVIVFVAYLCATCAYAAIWGGAPERIVAALFALAAAGSYFLLWVTPQDAYKAVEIGVLLIDLALFIGLASVALFANRYWPLWVAGLQAITVATHLVKGYDPTLIPFMYFLSSGKLSYLTQTLLAIGTWRHSQRIKLFGADRSWRRSSDPSVKMPIASPAN